MKERQFVVFQLSESEFAVPIADVKEIINTPEITQVPNSNIFFKGIISLRNRVIPIIDLHKKLSFDRENGEQEQIILVELNDKTVGLTVDCVNEVLKVDEDTIEDFYGVTAERENLVKGIIKKDKRLIVIINLQELLENSGVISWEEIAKVI